MTSTRVKLPSIAELTSATKTIPSNDRLPLLAFNSTPYFEPCYSRHQSVLGIPSPGFSPEINPIAGQSRTKMASIGQVRLENYSYGPTPGYSFPVLPDHRRHGHMHQQLEPMYNGQGNLCTPGLGTNSVFSVPEVINRPINECHRCGTTETPEWRRGPNGLRTLCNACGLFHAKLVKRKGAAAAAAEVLHNKVYKGKNGRRVSVKRQITSDGEQVRGKIQTQVFEIPPAPHHTGLLLPFPVYGLPRESHRDDLHQSAEYQRNPCHTMPYQYEIHQPQLFSRPPMPPTFLPAFPHKVGMTPMMSPPEAARLNPLLSALGT